MIKIRTSLFGIRYFMRHWFFTSATIVISTMTLSIFLGFVGFYMAAKSSLKALIFKIYPEQSKKRTTILKKKKLM